MNRSYFFAVALLLIVQTQCAQADPARWWWVFASYGNSQNLDRWMAGTCGVDPSASDGYDSLDEAVQTAPMAYNGTYHETGADTWVGPTGFYGSDMRSHLPLVPGSSKTWAIYVWGDPALPDDVTMITLQWLYTSYTPPDYLPPEELRFTLTLRSKPIGLTGGPAEGSLWDLSAHPDGIVTVPVFRTANGLEGYVFDFTATVVPEPSSLSLLSLALAGVGIGAVRRRR